MKIFLSFSYLEFSSFGGRYQIFEVSYAVKLLVYCHYYNALNERMAKRPIPPIYLSFEYELFVYGNGRWWLCYQTDNFKPIAYSQTIFSVLYSILLFITTIKL